MPSPLKLRRAVKHFMERTDGRVVVKASYCIEILHNRRWQLLGDEKGIMKFATSEERDKALVKQKEQGL